MNRGDKCRVRLHTGEVVEAVYSHKSGVYDKDHFVDFMGNRYRATRSLDIRKGFAPQCRFVGNPCVLLHEGVSV